MSSLDQIQIKIKEIHSFIVVLEKSLVNLKPEQYSKYNTIIGASVAKSVITLLEEYTNILKSYKPLPFEQSFHIGKPEPNYVTKEELTTKLETINLHIKYLSQSVDELNREFKFHRRY